MFKERIYDINDIPYEILFKIFKLCSPKCIIACSAVCRRWKHIIDFIATDQSLWRKHCETDYSDICHLAYVSSTRDLSWYNLYKSLTLWARLPYAKEIVYEIDLTKKHAETCINFQLLHGEIIGILLESGIVYYELDTLKQLHELTIIDQNESIMYKETGDVLLLINDTDQLLVIDKNSKIVTRFEDVFFFTIIEDVIYYVTNANIVFKCTFIDGDYTSTIVVQIPNKVMLLGHANDVIYIMTDEYEYYSFVNGTLKMVHCNGSNREKLEALRKYNFANRTDWQTEYDFYKSYLNNQDEDIPEKDNIQIIRIHGPVMLVGYKNFMLRIFHSVYTTSVIDLLKSTPIKVCNLLEGTKDQLMGIILNIHVIEGKHSHTVIVATPVKIIVIKFTHPSSYGLTNCKESPTNLEEPPTICVKTETSGVKLLTDREKILTRHKTPQIILNIPSTSSERTEKFQKSLLSDQTIITEELSSSDN